MPHRILIVDDDREFNTLLTDVYRQARYEVTTAANANHALELFEVQEFDLIVTDQRMPEKTGLEFIREIYQVKPNIPIVVVSGYLDSRTIRELIREGVSGVFMKPLNIFSLLKRSTELIQKQKLRDSGKAASAASSAGALPTPTLPFHFKTFPARASASLEFARKAYALREFNKCLLVIGEEGSDYVTLAADFSEWQSGPCSTLVLRPNELAAAAVVRRLESIPEDQLQNCTIMLLNADSIPPENRETLYHIASAEGPFARWSECSFRFIVCIQKEVDELYDEGVIDETFYIFLGSKELVIPPLREIPEDIPQLAAQYLRECRPDLKLDYATHSFIIKRPWKRNAEELRSLIESAAEISEKGATLDVAALQRVLKPIKQKASQPASDENPLLAYVRSQRDDYARALLQLCGGNIGRAAQVLGCREDYMHSLKPAEEAKTQK